MPIRNKCDCSNLYGFIIFNVNPNKQNQEGKNSVYQSIQIADDRIKSELK